MTFKKGIALLIALAFIVAPLSSLANTGKPGCDHSEMANAMPEMDGMSHMEEMNEAPEIPMSSAAGHQCRHAEGKCDHPMKKCNMNSQGCVISSCSMSGGPVMANLISNLDLIIPVQPVVFCHEESFAVNNCGVMKRIHIVFPPDRPPAV